MRLMAAVLFCILAGGAQAADVSAARHADAGAAPYGGAVEVPGPFVVPVIRHERWSTTYYPALPWGGLRKTCPIPLARSVARRSRPAVLMHKG
jgi:hypothetical protein